MRAGRRRHICNDDVPFGDRKTLAYPHGLVARFTDRTVVLSARRSLGLSDYSWTDDSQQKQEGDTRLHGRDPLDRSN